MHIHVHIYMQLYSSHSPNSPRTKTLKGGHSITSSDEPTKPEQDLNYHVRQVKNALQHFKDVISRNRLEVLPGNGTVVLESIANVHTSLQSYTLNENSSAFISATTQVYLSLGKLIKLCDEVLLSDDDTNCASLNKENVAEVVDLVDSAVQVTYTILLLLLYKYIAQNALGLLIYLARIKV